MEIISGVCEENFIFSTMIETIITIDVIELLFSAEFYC